MIDRIVYQVQAIEDYLANNPVATSQQTINNQQKSASETTPFLSEKEHRHNKLRRIVKLLKLTYQVLQNEGITPILSLKHIHEIHEKVYEKIKKLIKTNTEPARSAYTQLLIDSFNWSCQACTLYTITRIDIPKSVQMILPIAQEFDKRVGFGQCLGYLLKWSHDMYLYNQWIMRGAHSPTIRYEVEEMKAPSILNKIPFHGMANTHFPPIFASYRLPAFRHISPITNEILNLQRSQYKFWDKKNPYYINKTIRPLQFLPSAKSLAHEMIFVSNNHINKVIQITLYDRIVFISHVVGLMKTHDHYFHFLDARHGIYRFRLESHFKEWFPKYFYSQDYADDYTFSSIHIIPSPENLKRTQDTAVKQYPHKIKTPNHITSILTMSSLYMMYGIFSPQNIFRKIKESKKALLAEKKQTLEQFHTRWNDKLNAHTSSYYKSHRWFSDDMQLTMQKSQPLKHKTGCEDDTALLPRFFSPKKPLDLSKLKRKEASNSLPSLTPTKQIWQ